MTKDDLERVVRTYYDGCNQADVDKMAACFVADAVHYFPAGAPQGTFFGAQGIAEGWRRAVEALGSRWTIDRLATDVERLEVTVEWTHWKTARGSHLRGAEICRFDASGLMTEIRAYYAAPATGHDAVHELGDFDYAGRDYPLAPPVRS
jgi:ketosteroid isomerase-like protein